jgi:hypothetical protein
MLQTILMSSSKMSSVFIRYFPDKEKLKVESPVNVEPTITCLWGVFSFVIQVR